ncbi:ABC transporter permease [Streptococcus ruminantium]|uniref:ABC transporter permease n=1 Tax=Streptococcus ruminantium TaxID=1917441 RepID=UPI000E72FCBD|nr:ABC transporter permease [Streptococcus ruminantium]
MSYFLAELRRGLKSRLFLISCSLTFIALIVGVVNGWSSIQGIGGLSFFLYAFSLGGGAILPILIPILVSFPFSHSYIEDTEHNMIYAVLSRTTVKNYFFTKFFAIGCVASLSLFLPLLLLLVINQFLFPIGAPIYLGDIKGAWSFIFQENQLWYVMITIIHSTFFAFIYANLSFVSTIYLPNKVTALVAPFLVYYLPSFVFPFVGLDVLEPVNTFDLTANSASNELFVYGQLGCILFLTVVLGIYKIQKELILDGYGDA